MQSRVEESGLRESKGLGSPPGPWHPGQTTVEGGGAAPRHWQTLTGMACVCGCSPVVPTRSSTPLAPWCLASGHLPLPASLTLPPTRFRAEPGETRIGWIGSTALSSLQLSFVGERSRLSQRFGATALGAEAKPPEVPPLQYRIMHVSAVTMLTYCTRTCSCRPSAKTTHQLCHKN